MSATIKCNQCGASVDPSAERCKYCGEPLPKQQQQVIQPQVVYQQPVQQPYQQPTIIIQQAQQASPVDPSWPIKSRTAAGLLALFLGGIGIHKFYLGRTGMGVLYLLFCWTGIPAIAGFIEGIIYLTSNDHNFMMKHKVRLQ